MSKSRRKTPKRGLCADSDKSFKQAEHRRERRAVKVALSQKNEVPAQKAYGDPWKSDKDGKIYYADPDAKALRK